MQERDRALLDLQLTRGKLMIESLSGIFKSLKVISEKNYFASKIYYIANDIIQIILTNTEMISNFINPKPLSFESDEFFEELKSAYVNVKDNDWNDSAFDVYDQKY